MMETENENQLNLEDVDLLQNTFRYNIGHTNPADQHIWSYNNFLNDLMKPYEISYKNEKDHHLIRIHDIKLISEKNTTPAYCRKYYKTYSKTITALLSHKINDNEITENSIEMGQFPIMVGSSECITSSMTPEEKYRIGECIYDTGGYFILNGSERAMEYVKYKKENIISVYKSNEWLNNSFGGASIRSCDEDGNEMTLSITLFKEIHPNIKDRLIARMHFPNNKDITISALTLLSAFKEKNNTNLYNFIFKEHQRHYKELNELVEDIFIPPYISQKEAIADLIDSSGGDEEIINDILPHQKNNKSQFIAHMIQKLLLTILGKYDSYDENNLITSNIATPQQKMKNIVDKYKKDMTNHILDNIKTLNKKRKPKLDWKNILNKYLNDSNAICSTIEFELKKEGLTEMVNRHSLSSARSNFKKIHNNHSYINSKECKISRKETIMHPSQYGFICPTDTPSDENLGKVINLSMFSTISKDISYKRIIKVLKKKSWFESIDDIPTKKWRYYADIFVNGILVGGTPVKDSCKEKMNNILISLKYLRKNKTKFRNSDGMPSVNFTVLFDGQDWPTIHIFSTEGRLIRPLLVVNNGQLVINKDDISAFHKGIKSINSLIIDGSLEYLDTLESRNVVICSSIQSLLKQPDERITHCELTPDAILSLNASFIPFFNHNPPSRNSLSCKNSRHAIGIPTTNLRNNSSKRTCLLYSNQKPIVATESFKCVSYNEMCGGTNCLVAIMTDSGYNQEDSIIISKSAVQRGLFTSLNIKIYSFICPQAFPPLRKIIPGTYLKDKYNIKSGVFVSNNDILVSWTELTVFHVKESDIKDLQNVNFIYGYKYYSKNMIQKRLQYHKTKVKMQSLSISNSDTTSDSSDDENVIYAVKESSIIKRYDQKNIGKVSEIIEGSFENGKQLLKVVIESESEIEAGDKLASRHGQKGIIGQLMRDEDMPFTEEGLVPDLIVNPHAYPSRMTIGEILEGLFSKVCLAKWEIGYVSCFTENPLSLIENQLMDYGFDPSGAVTMYDGITGRQFDTKIFFAPIFFQKILPMAKDQIHARGYGPMDSRTHQPTQSKSADGGYKIGEMESAALVAHGSALLLNERMYRSSDNYNAIICKDCGRTASNGTDEELKCEFCPNGKVCNLKLCYGTRSLCQHLEAANLQVRMKIAADKDVIQEGIF